MSACSLAGRLHGRPGFPWGPMIGRRASTRGCSWVASWALAAEAYSVWLEESEHAHMLASGEVAWEHTQLERDGGWSPPRVMMAEAVEQAMQRAERAHTHPFPAHRQDAHRLAAGVSSALRRPCRPGERGAAAGQPDRLTIPGRW